MPEKTSIFTEAVEHVVGFMEGERQFAAKAKPLPFMEERVSLRDARARWGKMPREQRRAYIASHGVEEVLKLVRKPAQRGFAESVTGAGEEV